MKDFFLPPEYVEKQLESAPYDPSRGIRMAKMANLDDLTLIAIKLDPGKHLTPHLHEKGGEICIPLSEGLATLGEAQRTKTDEFKTDADGNIVVKWNKPQKLIPGKPIEIKPAQAHHLYTPGDKPVIVYFILPTTHLDTDKRFTTYPAISS